MKRAMGVLATAAGVLWIGVLGLAVLGLAVEAAAQSPDICRRTGYRLDSSVRAAESIMTVNQNGHCSSALNQSSLREPRVERRPTSGQVEFNGNNYVYTPNPGFTGGDRFVVSWANAPDGSRVALTVSVRVEPPGSPALQTAAAQVNAPRRTGTCRVSGAGIHGDQSRFGAETITVSRNFRCGGSWTGVSGITLETPPSHGTVELSGNRHTYTPTPGYTGTDSYVYRVSHAAGRIAVTVNVTVIP
jgi:hypothetical protein